jgi:hypothetical protein
MVQIGQQGQSVRFPVEVSHEDKPEKINRVLPVVGTTIRIRLKEYLPDLKWEAAAVEDPNGGIVAKLRAKGENFEQEVLLCADDPSTQSFSSSIGGVTLVGLHDPNIVEKLVPELADANAVGIVSVWLEDAQSPIEYVVTPGHTISIPELGHTLSVLSYVPHYSIDTETKEVTNQSKEPVNPAIKVRVESAEETYEQWLWAKFPSFAHDATKHALNMKFTNFVLGHTEGTHLLVVSLGSRPWILSSTSGKVKAEPVTPGKPYPFTNKEYYFSVEEIIDHAVIETRWSNNSEQLLHPAFVAVVEEDDIEQEAVLELNRPYHGKTSLGTMVLLYGRQQVPMKP